MFYTSTICPRVPSFDYHTVNMCPIIVSHVYYNPFIIILPKRILTFFVCSNYVYGCTRTNACYPILYHPSLQYCITFCIHSLHCALAFFVIVPRFFVLLRLFVTFARVHPFRHHPVLLLQSFFHDLTMIPSLSGCSHISSRLSASS